MTHASGFRPATEDDTPIRDFLLGKTPESDRDQFEQRLLTDPDFSEWVSAIEEELIDDYTAGLLSRDERHRFEDCFLVTEERRRRVRFSAALAQVKVPVPVVPRNHAWLQLAAAAVLVLSLGAGSWMAYSMRQTLDELEIAQNRIVALEQAQQTLVEDFRRQLAEAEERASAAVRAAEDRTPRSGSEALPMIVATLFPGALRDPGSDVPSVRIPPGTQLAEFRLELAEDSDPSYAASIHDPSGVELFRVSGLRSETTPDRILVSLQVPAERLPQGDYSVRLWGKTNGELTELDRYYVRVARN
jgi:hypothetical protein